MFCKECWSQFFPTIESFDIAAWHMTAKYLNLNFHFSFASDSFGWLVEQHSDLQVPLISILYCTHTHTHTQLEGFPQSPLPNFPHKAWVDPRLRWQNCDDQFPRWAGTLDHGDGDRPSYHWSTSYFDSFVGNKYWIAQRSFNQLSGSALNRQSSSREENPNSTINLVLTLDLHFRYLTYL